MAGTFADIQSGIATLQADVTKLSTDTIAVLNQFKAGTPVQQADIDAAITGLQNLDLAVKTLDSTVNPPTPAPVTPGS